jgi:hypothetical protein
MKKSLQIFRRRLLKKLVRWRCLEDRIIRY